MALVGVELETLVFEPDAQTTRSPPCATSSSNKMGPTARNLKLD